MFSISTGLQGDYEKAGLYYMASVKEINKPHEFVFPYYGQQTLVFVYFNCFILWMMLQNFITVICLFYLPNKNPLLWAFGHRFGTSTTEAGRFEKCIIKLRKGFGGVP